MKIFFVLLVMMVQTKIPRTLYSIVFNDNRLFSDIGCEGKACWSGSYRMTHGAKLQNVSDENLQEYNLFPNPNDGNIVVKQLISDNNPVYVEVLNATGENVYSGKLVFTNNITNIGLGNLSAGLYLLKLIDNQGRVFMVKFTIIN